MSGHETTDSDKLMIVESGRRKNKLTTELSSPPPTFERQIIGRHVVYKSSDGSRLRSMAEVRRYFKNRDHPFVESQFDFTPPDLSNSSKKKAPPTSSTNNSDKKSNNRLKTQATPPKSSPSKTTGRRELADDLKTIKNALKDDDLSGQDTFHESQLSPKTSPSKRRAGRPKKQEETTAGTPTLEETTGHTSADVVSTLSTPVSTMDKATSDQDSNDRNRPSRQRRPNQRYTDLISESESPVRKKPRKEFKLISTPTFTPREMKPAAKIPVPKVSVLPAPRAFPALQFGRLYKANTDTVIGTSSNMFTTNVISKPKRGRPKKVVSVAPDVNVQVQKIEMPVMAEMLIDKEETFSPVATQEFEAPPEFVEIQEPALIQQEDLLPPVLPVAPSSLTSSLYSNVMTASGTVLPKIKSPATSFASFRRIDTGSAPRTASYSTSSSFGSRSLSPEKKIVNPIRRGRKPRSMLAQSAAKNHQNERSYDGSFGRSNAHGYSTSHSYRAGYEAGLSMKNEYSLLSSRMSGQSSALDSPPLLDMDAAGSSDDHQQQLPRGIARLQYGGAKKITIGRYGAKSASVSLAPDPPPELELYGLAGNEKPVTHAKQNDQRTNRQADATDPNLYCHLPPEVVSDHCYGRQPDVPSATNDEQPKVVAARNVAPKSREIVTMPSTFRTQQPYRRSPQQYYRKQTGISPTSYQTQRHHVSISNNLSTFANVHVGDYHSSTGTAISSTMGGQQMAMLIDKLPANILEEDDGDGNDFVASVSID